MTWSYDWLTASQDHASGCPIFGSDLVITTDVDTGEYKRERVDGFQHEGSYDTSIRIRSDGHRVEVSGNPSRFGRPDNVFGFQSMDDCMALYNSLLVEHGLPPFTKGDAWDTQAGNVKILDGCRFSRVDLNRNYQAGSASAASMALRGLSACSRRGKPWQTDANGSVTTGNKKYMHLTYYAKGPEMKAHGNSNACKCPERHQVMDWCNEVGLIRFEAKFGRNYLIQNKLNGWILWSETRAREIAASYDKVNEMTFATTDYQHIADDLEHKFEFKRNRALKAQHAALAWLSGEDLRQSMSKSAFYRVTADLAVVGIDARAPCNVATLPVRVRVVDLRPAEVPSWYQKPERPFLRLVA